MTKKVVQVAVAIIQNRHGELLLASRPNGKGWAGWWEFPGGKVELGESPAGALGRELQEELDITPTKIQPWLKRRYNYPATKDDVAKTVLLHFFFVTEWEGELQAQEEQKLSWQTPANITVEPVLPANTPIMNALALPAVYAISNAHEMGEPQFLKALKRELDSGLQLIQLREKHLDEAALLVLAKKIVALAEPYKAKVLINQYIDIAKAAGAHGVHLPSVTLMQLRHKPEGLLVAASCHTEDELVHAAQLDLDFVVLSPVARTKSHIDAEPLGWQRFATLAEAVEIPMYALGGMRPVDLPQALTHGARGIAMQRAAWEVTL